MKNYLRAILPIIGRVGARWLIIGILASMILGAVEYGVALFIQFFLLSIGLVDKSLAPAWVMNHPELLGVRESVALLIIIGLVRAVSQLLSNQSSVMVKEAVCARLRMQTSFQILKSQANEVLVASEVSNRFNEIFPKAGLFLFYLSRVLVSSLQEVLLACCMFYFAWKESLVGLTSLFFVGFVVLAINRKLRLIAAAVPAVNMRLMQGIERVSRNWIFLKISRTEDLEYRNLIKNIALYFDRNVKASLLGNLASSLTPFLGFILIGGIILISQLKFHTLATALVAFLYLFVRFVQQLSVLVGDLGSANSFWPHFQLSMEVLNEQPEGEMAASFLPSEHIALFRRFDGDRFVARSMPECALSDTKENAAPPDIEMKDVTYFWETQAPIMTRFTSSMPAGKITGITGRSGTGKSTILMLVLGILKPKSGQIRIDSMSPCDYFGKHIQNVGYVGVEPFLIQGSIRDNLIYGLNRDVSIGELKEILKKTALYDEINSMPLGLDHQLNENGDGLSAGQKQRLSLARALLKKPNLLILDEASANLDEGTEAKITETVSELRGQATIIIVSHRKGLLRNVDNHIHLEHADVSAPVASSSGI